MFISGSVFLNRMNVHASLMGERGFCHVWLAGDPFTMRHVVDELTELGELFE